MVNGYTPKSIEKRITFTLIPYANTTRIISNTSLTKDHIYTNVTLTSFLILFAVSFKLISFIMDNIVSSMRLVIPMPISPRNPQELIIYNIYDNAISTPLIATILFYIILIISIFSIASNIYSYLRRDRFSEEILKYMP
jgi:hypothetical protein